MTDALVSRQARGSVAPALPTVSQDAAIERAKLYAGAGDLVPTAFRNKPGACLLAMHWASHNGVDDLTAMQGLHIIDGKPSVSAALRVQLATDKGFEIRVLTTTDLECSADVYDHRDGAARKMNQDGPIKVEITQIPPYRFNRTSNGKESNWTLYPADMLFAHVCRIADRRFIKTAAALVDASQDFEHGDGQVLDIEELPAEETPVGEDPWDVDPPGPPASAPDTTEATPDDRRSALKAAMADKDLRTPALLKETRTQTGTHYPTLQALADHEGHTCIMLDWLDSL